MASTNLEYASVATIFLDEPTIGKRMPIKKFAICQPFDTVLAKKSRRHPVRSVALACAALSQSSIAATGTAAPTTDLTILKQANNGHVAAVQAILPRLRDPALRAIAAMILAADHLDDRGVRTALARFIATGDQTPQRGAVAWSVAASSAFASGDYAAAMKDGDEWLHALSLSPSPGSSVDAANVRATAAALARAPEQKLVSRASAVASTSRDQAGLLRTESSINGLAQSVVLDTGANVSTISLSAARRLGLHILSGNASVASSTRSAVNVRVGYADTLDVAGARFANVAFLVLDDDQLAVPIPGYKLDVILGFPIFRAMERVRFSQNSFRPFAPIIASSHAATVHFDGNSMFVAVTINKRPADLQLDSGAPATTLTATFAARNADLVASLPHHTSRQTGAGGTSRIDEAQLPDATIELGQCRARLPMLSVGSGPVTPRSPDGQLGQDVTRQFAAHTIDFRRAKLEIDGGACLNLPQR